MADTLPISKLALGYDPSWFTGERILTQGERVQQARDAWRAKNPNAPYMPSDADLGYMYSNYEDLFPGQLMTQEGSKAYTDLVDKLDKQEQLNSVLQTAALAAAAFGGASLMGAGSGAGAGTGTISSMGFEAPSLMGSSGLSLGAPAAIDYAALSIPELGALGGTAGIGTLGSMGGESVGMMGSVAPELTAPLSTAGSEAAASQLAMGGAPVGLFGDIPAVPEVGGPVAQIPEHNFLPVGTVPTLAATGGLSGLGSLLSGAGSKLADFATSPGGIASLVGAAAGAAGGGGGKTATTQSQIDPRMQQYLYGSGVGDKNSLLGAAQSLYQSNPTGINSTMQQGLDMQRQTLLDPKYAQGYQQLRDFGSSLLSGFGQGGLSPSVQAGGGLLNTADRTKALMARGRGLMG